VGFQGKLNQACHPIRAWVTGFFKSLSYPLVGVGFSIFFWDKEYSRKYVVKISNVFNWARLGQGGIHSKDLHEATK
jgi:hypothetical protein